MQQSLLIRLLLLLLEDGSRKLTWIHYDHLLWNTGCFDEKVKTGTYSYPLAPNQVPR
jgi:hypothetical protein